MRRLFRSSLSARLLTIFVLTAVAAAILMMSLFSRGLGSQWQRAIAPHLAQYVSYVRQDLGTPPDEARARSLAARLPIEIQVHRDGQLQFTTADVPIKTEELRFFTPGRYRRGRDDEDGTFRERGPKHEFAFNDDNRRPVLRLVQGDSTIFVELAGSRGRGRGLDEMLYAVGGLGLLLTLCYLGIRRLLAPIGRLQTTVQKISEGDLTARSHERGQDDLAQLANSVDTMSDRLQQMLDAKRELLLAISHELRSPLTRARVATELLDSPTHHHRLIREIEEMETLIAQLVESERLQEHTVLNCQTLDVARVIGDIRDRLNAPFDWKHSGKSVIIEADEARLVVLIRNLLNNALHHARGASGNDPKVSIRLVCEQPWVRIIVNDDGPGIDKAHLNAITDAFYRPDASRTRKTGGFGLGLYLCRRIAEAHGGNLLVESPGDNEVGTRVTVQLPWSKD
ncbi:MAG: sensor histidine kinase [Granulosicoccus sp.]